MNVLGYILSFKSLLLIVQGSDPLLVWWGSFTLLLALLTHLLLHRLCREGSTVHVRTIQSWEELFPYQVVKHTMRMLCTAEKQDFLWNLSDVMQADVQWGVRPLTLPGTVHISSLVFREPWSGLPMTVVRCSRWGEQDKQRVLIVPRSHYPLYFCCETDSPTSGFIRLSQTGYVAVPDIPLECNHCSLLMFL